MSSLRQLIFASLVAALVVLTGCANVQPKVDAFEQQSKQLGTIYAQVNKITSNKDFQSNCGSSRYSSQARAAVCGDGSMDAVLVSWVTRGGKTLTMMQAVKSSEKLVPGAIVILDMSKPLARNFVSVVASEETDACHWSGKRNYSLDSGVRNVTTFTATFVSVAAAPVLAAPLLLYGRNDFGGVVCNDWSYQEAYKDKDINRIFDIF